MQKIPNVFYLYWQGSSFSIHQYVCVKSILEIEKPETIYLYYNDPIPQDNIWWDRTLELVVLKEFKSEDFPEFGELVCSSNDIDKLSVLKRSDIFRALILYTFGGIYTDFDTITIKSIRDQIDDCSVFLPQCRYATAGYDRHRNMFVPISESQKSPYSHLAYGNLGSVSKHHLFYEVLKEIKENPRKKYANILFCFINVYEKNKHLFLDTKAVPWQIFHSICERERTTLDEIEGRKKETISIEDFFQNKNHDGYNDLVRVYHYYSSKKDTKHLLLTILTPYAVKYSNSTYAKYAAPLIQPFCKNWKKDGHIVTPDRIILEQKIIPYLTGQICFVGVASYIKHYWSEIFPKDTQVTSVDSNKKVAEYGSPFRHIVCDMKYIYKHTQTKFDYIVMNGIAGYGSTTVTMLMNAFRGAFSVLKPGGLLIYGWGNNDKIKIKHPTKRINRPKVFFNEKLCSNFEITTFLDLPEECCANNYIDSTIEYNVPLEDIKDMDVRFMFFRKPS